jgi:hypothetical protein
LVVSSVKSLVLNDDATPESVSPPHTEFQTQTPSTLNAAFDFKPFGLAVKLPALEAFNQTEAAVKTIYHPFYQRVSSFFWNVPKPNLPLPKKALHLRRVIRKASKFISR